MNNPNRTKMVIALRKDLKMSRGKSMAQVAHAAMKVFFDRMNKRYDEDNKHISYELPWENLTPEMIEWKEEAFTKVVVGINSEDEIYELAKEAKEAGIPYAVMIDNGFTEFAGRKTTTCIAIGPDEVDKLDKITGDLKLI